MNISARASGETMVPVSICRPEHRRWILWAAILASSMGFIDSTVTAVAMPAMRATLSADLAQAQWINAAYLLTLTSLILSGGALGDRFGTGRIFACGIVLFTLSSMGCALAPSADWLIGARAVQGMAAALMVPGSMAIIGRAYPRAERGRALGFWTAAATATTAGGPILGGFVLHLAGDWAWRLVFAINLPLGALSLWLLLRAMQRDRGRPERAVDLPGAVLATLGLGLCAWSMIHGGTVPLIAGLASLAAFLAWEAHTPAPMLRLGMFRNMEFSAANLATFLLWTAITGMGFYLPMHAIAGLGISPFQVALSNLPVSLLIVLLSAPSGRLADRIGAGPLLTVGAGVVALAQVGQALTLHYQSYWSMTVPLIALSGLGMAILVAPLTAAIMQAADDSEQGAASGINNAVARAGGLVAVAVLGGVAAHGYGAIGAEMPGYGVSARAAEHIAASARGFAAISWVCAGLAALSALVSAFGIKRST